MADPTHGPLLSFLSPILDDFNRPDGDPGANWTGTYKPQIVSQKLYTAGGTETANWYITTESADCEVWGTPGTAGNARVFARSTPSGVYYLRSSAPPSWLIICKDVGGGDVTLAECINPLLGAPFALTCIGSLLRGYYWDGSNWINVLSVTDTSLSTVGTIGVQLGGGATLDNFGGNAKRARLVPQKMIGAGLEPTYTDAACVFIVANNGRVLLHFKNSGANACTVTITTTGLGHRDQIGNQALSDQLVTVPANTGSIMSGPFPEGVYNDGFGDLSFTFSEFAGVSVAALEVD